MWKKCHVLFEWSLLCFLQKSFCLLTQPQIVETRFSISDRRSHSPTREMIDWPTLNKIRHVLVLWCIFFTLIRFGTLVCFLHLTHLGTLMYFYSWHVFGNLLYILMVDTFHVYKHVIGFMKKPGYGKIIYFIDSTRNNHSSS